VAAKFKRTGLHRLDCPMCPGYAYGTVANLESVGLPVCACGERMQPARIELALMLEADDAPVMTAYRSKVSSVAHGQAWTGRGGLEQPEQRAVDHIAREQRHAARQRRIAALMPVAQPMPF
jgi:hypothetical protein